MNLTYNVILCLILLCATVGMFLYRRWLENHNDSYIHLSNSSHDATIITSQQAVCKRCETVDKIKNAMLAATILYAVVIAGYASYLAWNRAGL
ncbi:MAG: hypothetical protein JOY85_05585 [Acidobacteriaceae bacterium]|nr:hypothetical protein [Acidobacteriaceae bacterium]